MINRKICVITGTRAEYGLLQPIMNEINNDKDFELQLIVTGMHLSPEFGSTYRSIEDDGFVISEKIEILLSSDTSIGVSKAMGLATISFSEALNRLNPDFIMLLGDRFELLAAAQAALVSRIPIIHIAGGDVTEGAFDEAIRHSITKMSHLHFVTNEDSKKRVIQLGEIPENVFLVGNPGLDQLRQLKLLNKDEIQKRLKFKLRKKNVLVTFHPATLDDISSKKSFKELLSALSSLDENIGIIFTKPNADTEGRVLIQMLDDFVKNKSNCVVHTSLGQLLYLSTISIIDVVIGNSSSGLLEVPSLKKPTVNVGDRQKGRIQADSVISCAPEVAEINIAILKAFELDCSKAINPYGDGRSSKRVIDILKIAPSPQKLIKKRFHDIDFYY